MGIKFLLNILYNLGIILAIYTIYWSFQHTQYAYLAGALFILVVFVMLKLRLVKEVKNTLKKP